MLKCKILNKNNNAYFNILEGAVFIENYNETLDSGTIRLAHLFNKIDIEPFDMISIENVSSSNVLINERVMCVDNFTCSQTSLDPAIYEYEIHLFSLTKLLEGILLPSLSITRLKNATPRNVSYYLENYLSEYGTKLNSNGTLGKYDDLFYFNDDLLDRFNSIECPELQWNEPTLREVLTDLMMVDDCIPICSLGEEDKVEIGFIDISSVGNEITNAQKLGINFIHENHSSSDYVSELKCSLQNGVGEGETTKICEDITFRNYETYLLTTENVQLETSLDIWNLISFNVSQYIVATFSYRFIEETEYHQVNVIAKLTMDLMPYTLEYRLWQSKPIYYSPFSSSFLPNSSYQNTSLYYTRGAKGIFNFNSKIEKQRLWVKSQVSVLELVLALLDTKENETLTNAFFEQTGLDPSEVDYTYTLVGKSDWKGIRFNVEYEPIGNHTFFASKSPFRKYQRQVVDNQTQSYVNIKRQGMLEYFKANRLGNKLKIVNARYNVNESVIPQLAEKINGSIIFQKQIAVSNNYIKANFLTTDNYVLRDYFTGVKSKLRSTPILSGNEAFIRSDVIKFYINGSGNIGSLDENYIFPVYLNDNAKPYDESKGYNSGDYCMYNGEMYFCHSTTGYGSFDPSDWTNLHLTNSLQDYINKFNYCVVVFNTKDGSQRPVPNQMKYENVNQYINAYMLEFQKAICGNSAIFTFKLLDNSIVGNYISSDQEDLGNNEIVSTQQPAIYTDGDGEIIGGTIRFYETINVFQELYFSKLYPGVTLNNPNFNQFSNLVAMIPFTIHKDNKEILQITIQIEKNNEANDLFLGKK